MNSVLFVHAALCRGLIQLMTSKVREGGKSTSNGDETVRLALMIIVVCCGYVWEVFVRGPLFFLCENFSR